VSTEATPTTIRTATPADAAAATAVLVASFLDGPIADWLIPDRDTRRAVYQRCFAVVVDHALAHGVIHTTPDLDAVALWYPMLEPLAEDPDLDARLADAAGEHIGRYLLKLTATAGHHPTAPHHHLAFLGVHPDRQTRGLGSRLLNTHHHALDTAGTPAYLEATSQRNRALYLRHGYRSADPVVLPDGGPPMWPMWRPPAAAPDRQDLAEAIHRAAERAGIPHGAVVTDRESGLVFFGGIDDMPDDLRQQTR